MKRFLYTILAAGLLTACYEDKGNYDYNFDQMNEITSFNFTPEVVEGLEGKVIELQQPLTEAETIQRVEVQLEQTLPQDNDKLTYHWIRSYKNSEDKNVKDTIETKGFLDVELPVGKEMKYSVLLKVTDQSTSLSKYTNFVIKTRPIFKNSIFVLHGNEGSRKLGNIETIGTETKVRMDAYNTVYPDAANPFGNAVGMNFTSYSDFDWSTYTSNNRTYLSVYNSDGTAGAYHPFGLEYKFHPTFILPKAEQPFIYQRTVETGGWDGNEGFAYRRCVISKDGRFYLGNFIPKLYVPGETISIYGGDANHQTDYRVTAATVTWNRYIMWDAKYNRFLYVNKNDSYESSEAGFAYYTPMLSAAVLDANVDFSTLPADASPVGKTAVYAYIQYRENYQEAHPFFIFKDEESGKFYLYELLPLNVSSDGKDGKAITRGDDGKDDGKDDGEAQEPMFSIASYKVMRNFAPGDDLSTIFYNTWFTSNYIFYTDGGNLYRYNTNNYDVTLIYSAPSGYTISVVKTRENGTYLYNGDLGYYLNIGLNKGNEGAVAEIKLTTASDLDEDYPALFYNQSADGEKFGNIKDVQFVHELWYVLPDYMQ